jgi:hypothetical protein
MPSTPHTCIACQKLRRCFYFEVTTPYGNPGAHTFVCEPCLADPIVQRTIMISLVETAKEHLHGAHKIET